MTAGSSTASRPLLRFAVVAFVFALSAAACSSSTTTTTSTASEGADDAAAAEPTTAAAADPTAAPDPTAVPADTGDGDDGAMDDSMDDAATDDEPMDDDAMDEAMDDEAMDDDSTSDDAMDDNEEQSTASIGDFSDDDFCRVARDLDENDPFEDADLDPFSPEFFDAAAELYDGLLAIAPDEIRSDVELVRNELGRIGSELAAIDYDFTNPKFGEVMESLDGGTVEAAGLRIEDYLRDVCGIDVDAVDEVEIDDIPSIDLDDEALAGLSEIGPEEAAMLLAGLNLDPELQACLLEKLPELTASEDPSILTEEICGTTLLEILSSLSG